MNAIVQDTKATEINLASRVYEILGLENRIRSLSIDETADVGSHDENIKNIRNIVETSLDRGTVRYGLRVLSKYGKLTKDKLIGLAKDYNKRRLEVGNRIGAELRVDKRPITFFYMETLRKPEFTQNSMLIEGHLERVELNPGFTSYPRGTL